MATNSHVVRTQFNSNIDDIVSDYEVIYENFVRISGLVGHALTASIHHGDHHDQ